MKRYIDADALLERMKRDPLFPLVEKYGVSGVIEAEPTADVQEVRHGKWEDTGDGYLHRECGMFFDTYLWANRHYDIFHNGFNYCPNCGADMREGERRCTKVRLK